ncbi:MAG: Glycosyl transferase, group 1 [Methanoculleus marisnigri]|jgi:Glycosyltransferase|uniref:Glycosyl transferase, group 1 n=1 Tax=Methanoculleus marisnigri TaxID=2198 RepID=A0A101IXQ6_9EURY|nr:glycosyltransferase family 4 protein [Methanoculleus marisnigri]KUK63183.1 MAG: Glycosyl transferase, group 1 [Methanoculleus marisnigri]KUL03296.1 MAG: Glycosyl transferase, group 1 [Methanoculleus marisnigri]
METLKLAFFCWESLHSTFKVGGLAPAATHLAENLARKGHEVHFFTRGEGDDALINNVHYHYCLPFGDNIIEYCRTMSNMLVDAFRAHDAPPFDILHFHDWHLVEALHTLRGRNTVLSFHSTEYGRHGGNFGGWWEFQEISGKEWYGGYIAKAVATVSNSTKTEVMWLYNVPEWKVTVIPNGIDPDTYHTQVDPGEVKKRYGIHPLAPVVLFVGRLTYQKGPDLLMQAIPEILAKRWDVQFLFAGTGDMRGYLEGMAHGLPVQFLGYVSDEDHIRLLNACDLVAVPSRNEPFGLVLTEAWSAERCVVATDVGGLSENIDNYVNGIKVPVRPDSIAWGICHLIDDPAYMQKLGRAGRRKVIEKFQWGVVTERMLGVYRRILSSGDTRPGG